MFATHLEKTELTRVRRLHERGHYDRATVYSILDATPGSLPPDSPPTMMARSRDRSVSIPFSVATSASRMA